MSGQTVARKAATCVLLGNPNTGKSSLFGALTGARQKVANFPGVTVEAKLGTLSGPDGKLTLVDLPGTYSLSARSPDEAIAIDALAGVLPKVPQPDVALVVVDASNLERNLYLLTQVLEFELPVVVALSMVDVAANKGQSIDTEALAAALAVPVVTVHAPERKGLVELRGALFAACGGSPRQPLRLPYPEAMSGAVGALAQTVRGAQPERKESWPAALRLLVDGAGPLYESLCAQEPGLADQLRQQKEEAGGGKSLALLESQTRYQAISGWVQGCRQQAPQSGKRPLSDRIDDIVTHKLWGTLILALVLLVVFEALYTWSGPMMDAIDGGFGSLGEWVGATMADGPLKGLLVDGVIAGAGGVLVFLPQILFLFLFIGILEDLGYMARAAFLMDRLMARFGLSGRSFIPMLSGFACAIPGIMAARTIGDRKTRLATIFLVPFMSCSARLPVYTLMIGAFVPEMRVYGILDLRALVLFGMYLLGIVTAIPVAMVLNRGLLKGQRAPFLMELPGYKRPRLRTVIAVLRDRGGSFIKRAGTTILAVSVVVWALAYFPHADSISLDYQTRRAEAEDSFTQTLQALPHEEGTLWTAELLRDAEDPLLVSSLLGAEQSLEEELAQLDSDEAGAHLRNSYLGTMGRSIEPLCEPLGWDWRIGMAAVASFPAREVVVATMGTIFNVGEADESSGSLLQALRNAKRDDGTALFDLATALSIMVFFALCMQCAATLVVMAKETNSWRWPALSFTVMTVLAYVCAALTFQLTTWAMA